MASSSIRSRSFRSRCTLAGYLPGEADEIRKAVSKKIKEKIEGHKLKFIAGSVKNGIEQSVAEAVYGDIEFFARYGFNKAHAADYAVMTCQTAYLKAHYPVEYMTALMTVEQSIEKVGLLIVECRRMGIEVLPPHINYSDLAFTIEARPNGKRAIRFGMASIKGVGEGPVTVIREARLGGWPLQEHRRLRAPRRFAIGESPRAGSADQSRRVE